VQSDVIPYTVRFKELNDAMIEQYLNAEDALGCAGSLRAEGLGIALLDRFDGEDPTALIGLPLIRLTEMLRAEGYDPLREATA